MIRIYLIDSENQIADRLAERSEIEIVGSTETPLPDWNRNLDCDLVLVSASWRTIALPGSRGRRKTVCRKL